MDKLRPKQYFKTDFPWLLIHDRLRDLLPIDLGPRKLSFNFNGYRWIIIYIEQDLSINISINSGNNEIANFDSSAEDFINHSYVLGINKFLLLILNQIKDDNL